jgi:tripartite-type tricarboxylate transporter receptor subunit TctC
MLVASNVAILAVAASGPAAAQQSPAQFYAQNGLRIVVGSGSGGGYDVYARILQRFYNQHLPGKPNIIVQNMPGASGMTAQNWAYSTAPRDGSVILATYSALIDANLMGNTKAQFDTRKFNWLGSIADSPLICMTWHTSPYKDIRDMIGKPLTTSATGATGKAARIPIILNQILGTKFKVITGYSTNDSPLALERGEVDAICGMGYFTLAAQNPDWVKNKRINVVAQASLKPPPVLANVPNVLEMTKGPDRDLLEYGAILEAMGRPYLAPPGIPEDRLDALRTGFDETMKDPTFIAELARLNLNIGALTGKEMEQWIGRLYSFSPETIKRVAEMYGTGGE